MAVKKQARGLSQFLQAQGAPARPTEPPAAEVGPGAGAGTSATEARPARPARAAGGRAGRGAGAKAKPARRATKEGKEQLLVYLYPEGIKQLKLAEIEEDYPSVSAIVAEAVNDWLRKKKRPPVA